jgi:large subunit ribosomal protein L1
MSKRMDKLNIINKLHIYTIEQGIQQLQLESSVNFIESVDLCFRLGIDPKQADQNIRGTTILPSGLGKKVTIGVFADLEEKSKILEAGADDIGLEDLAEKIKKGQMFDVILSSEDGMKIVSKLGKILGPKGIMPSIKLGTVTNNLVKAVHNLKQGQVFYRNDKYGDIKMTVGRLNFSIADLEANIIAVYHSLLNLKPQTSKGQYFRKLQISSTMGRSFNINLASLEKGL